MHGRRITIFVTCMALLFPGMSSWAQGYSHLTLDQAIDIALENNRDVIDAEEEAVRAKLQVTEAAAGAYPKVNGTMSVDKNLKPQVFIMQAPDETGTIRKNRIKIGTDHQSIVGASLTQPIWVGGKIGTAIQAARIYNQMSSETLENVKQTVVTGVTSAYYSILLAQEVVGITRASLEQAQRHQQNVQNLYDAGRATKYDLLRSRVEVSNIKPRLMEAENNVRVSLLNLKDILGIDADAPLNLNGTLAEPDTTIFRMAELETGLENRPDFKAAQYTVDLREKNIKITRGDMLPTLTAGTTFNYVGNFDVWRYEAEDWNPTWSANVTLSFPIFSGFENYSRYQQSKVDFRKAKTNLQRTRNSIQIEIDQHVMSLRKALQEIESQRMTVREAEETVGLSESLFQNGKATQLEVLDAHLALDNARINLANAMYEALTAETNLKKSLGIIDTSK